MIAMENGTRHEVKTNLIFLGIGFSKRFNWAYICFAGRPRLLMLAFYNSRYEGAPAWSVHELHARVWSLRHSAANRPDHLSFSFPFESY